MTFKLSKLCMTYKLNIVQKKGIPSVKQHMYREVFNTEFNIHFIRPKSDHHDCCEDSKMNMEKGFTSLEYKKLFEHLIFLRSDRESRKVVLYFDMENVIQLPKTNISNFFYKRKLSFLISLFIFQ